MITNTVVRTNGFSYIATGKVFGKVTSFHLHLRPKYGDEIVKLPAEQANIYPRVLDKRSEEARNVVATLKEALMRNLSLAK